jgi:hypothetical protein
MKFQLLRRCRQSLLHSRDFFRISEVMNTVLLHQIIYIFRLFPHLSDCLMVLLVDYFYFIDILCLMNIFIISI